MRLVIGILGVVVLSCIVAVSVLAAMSATIPDVLTQTITAGITGLVALLARPLASDKSSPPEK